MSRNSKPYWLLPAMQPEESHLPKPLAGALLAGLAATFCAQPALAAFDSAYTDINLDQCLLLNADDFGASWACPGYRGYPLRIAEGDLRFLIGYGFNINDEPVGPQTLPPFNTLGPRMEWRLSNATGRFFPIATIVRYRLDKSEEREAGEVLVVTQLVEGNTCHIAYVDARANSNANELARAAADASGDFDCTSDEVEIIGTFSAW
jgi:hypothetical protein